MTAAQKNKGSGIFVDFLGKDVNVRYRDNDRVKAIHGKLIAVEGGHIKIDAEAGIFIIDEKNIVKVEASSQ